MSPYLPTVADLTGFYGLVITVMLLLWLGSAVCRSGPLPEVRVLAGWGVLCLVLTIWGVATPWSLRIPLVAVGLVAVLMLLVGSIANRPDFGPPGWSAWAGIDRMAILSLPFWLVLLPAFPSQVDTWLNLLPNAAYLVDHGVLPSHDRPPSWSFLPVAPYNTQFAVFAASVAAGHLMPNGLALFNLVLLALAGLLFARILSDDRDGTPPWWALACGLALAIPLNPGFVPRSFLSGYGETSLAVTALFAVWLAASLIQRLADRARSDSHAIALALVLAALVNTKQSGIGLLLPIGMTFLALVVTHKAIGWRRGTLATLGILTPALGLWLLWRGYAVTAFEAGELRPMPVSQWNFALLPVILTSVLRTIIQKATFYLCLLAVLALAVATWRRTPRSFEATLLALIAGTAILYNGFVLFTYIAHFPPEMARNAHSYFRYSGHLSLLVMLGLIVALRPAAELGVMALGSRARWAGMAAVALMVVCPLALTPMLRFDLQPPQPALFALARQVAAIVPDRAKLAIVVPGDPFDAAGSAIRGALLYLPPRRPNLDLITVTRADVETLAALHQQDVAYALLSCVRPGLESAGLTEAELGKVTLLRSTQFGWVVHAAWSWPTEHAGARFGALLERPIFCADYPR